LKQPLHTSIAIDTTEFTNFNVEDLLHVVISVKDFKAIVAHAGTTDTEVSAFYSYPSKPMQLKYTDDGIASEFILMTIGDHRGSSLTPAPAAARSRSASTVPKQISEASRHGSAQDPGSMAPPPRSMASNVASNPAKSRSLRPSPPPPQPTLNRESLFLTDDEEDDRRWDPSRYEDEEEDMLGWDATTDNVSSHAYLQGIGNNFAEIW
jgi:cell cycle checkpoint control protein RAD9A